jgi:flagellar motor component MotA
MTNLLKSFLGPIALLALLVLMILQTEGAGGIAVFLNLEAFLLVLIGTAVATWVAYPAADIAQALKDSLSHPKGMPKHASQRGAQVLRCSADAAMGMGILALVFGLILMLSNVMDVYEMPRRTALALDGLFFGLLISKGVLLPLSRRLEYAKACITP